MAKNYTEISPETTKTVIANEPADIKAPDLIQAARYRLVDLIMERVENGSNIDYIVKLSEVYRNIK